MPEGDTIFRAARTLHRALAGKPIVQFESVFPALDPRPCRHTAHRPDDRQRLRLGQAPADAFSGGLVLRTHMRMNGSWHIYRPGEALATAAPRHADRRGDRGFRRGRLQHSGRGAHGRPRISARHDELRQLGPDLLAETFDAAEALRRMKARPARGHRRRAAQSARHGRHRQRLQVGGAVRLPRQSVHPGRKRRGPGARASHHDGAPVAARQRALVAGADDDLYGGYRGAPPVATTRASGCGSTAARACRAAAAGRSSR